MKNLLIAVIFIFSIFILSVCAQKEICTCNSVLENYEPLKGNEDVVFSIGKVKQIKGRTFFKFGNEVFEDVVVEVYEVNEKERKNLDDTAQGITDTKKRKFACITGKDGKYCFKGLSKGTYVLRAGSVSQIKGVFNRVFVVVELDPKNGRNEEINIELETAT